MRRSHASPRVLLVDELAHTNAPNSRHPKRWQDVQELLDAGIDVWTTVNVQHLESLNDIVGSITGIRVRETLPDLVFDSADEIVLVDLPPDELLVRLKEGKVYLPEQAERATKNFFRKGNLLALRELALRRTADRVDREMRSYRRDYVTENVWRAQRAFLVASVRTPARTQWCATQRGWPVHWTRAGTPFTSKRRRWHDCPTTSRRNLSHVASRRRR